MIINHLVVEDIGFRKLVKALNPSYELPSRQIISRSYIPSFYVSHISLTTDCWTSTNNESLMGITVHFVGNNFCLRSILLQCTVFDQSHTSKNLAVELKRVTEEWGVKTKIVLAVSDNLLTLKVQL